MSDDRKSVDVVIPTHGRVDFLAEALESVRNQTLRANRVFVVSDMENPEAEALVRECSREFEGISYDWWQAPDDIPASGRAPISRNLAIARSRAEWIAPLDDDDRWDDCYLERATSLGVEEAADVVVAHTYFNPDRSGGKQYDGRYSERDFIVRNPGVNGSNAVFRRLALWRVGGFNPAVLGSADKEVMIRLMRNKARAAVLPERLVFHRLHVNNASGDPARMLLSLGALERAYAPTLDPLTRIRLWKKRAMLCYQIRRSRPRTR